jgi:hypothetical protein
MYFVSQYSVGSTVLHGTFLRWSEENGIVPMSQQMFTKLVELLSNEKIKRGRATGGIVIFNGVIVKD